MSTDLFPKKAVLKRRPKSGFASQAHTRWWEFKVSRPGRRGTMNDITSAIGIEQLKKLPAFIARRQEIHQYYNQALALDWLQLPPDIPVDIESSYYFYWIQIAPDLSASSRHALRDQLASYLRDNEIYTTFRYYPLHWVKFYGTITSLSNVEVAANSTLCLPIHQSLSNDDLARIVACIYQFGKDI